MLHVQIGLFPLISPFEWLGEIPYLPISETFEFELSCNPIFLNPPGSTVSREVLVVIRALISS